MINSMYSSSPVLEPKFPWNLQSYQPHPFDVLFSIRFLLKLHGQTWQSLPHVCLSLLHLSLFATLVWQKSPF